MCTFCRESNPHKSIGQSKHAHNTTHYTQLIRADKMIKIFFVCWLCGWCGIIFHLRVENVENEGKGVMNRFVQGDY